MKPSQHILHPRLFAFPIFFIYFFICFITQPSCLCLCLSCCLEDGKKGEQCWFQFLSACIISFPSLFWFYLSFYLFIFPSLLSHGLFQYQCLVPLCLTPPFLPAFLSGHFQTFGARQELPGVAYFSPPFPPVRSNTGIESSVSSQRQLQEDQLTAGQLVDLQTRKRVYLVSKPSVCWPLDF